MSKFSDYIEKAFQEEKQKYFDGHSNGHYRTVCKECGILMGQCRCRSENKQVKYDLCVKCGGIDHIK